LPISCVEFGAGFPAHGDWPDAWGPSQ